MWDILILGGGPAGLSAAMTAVRRKKTAAVVSLPMEESAIYPSRLVENYPGVPSVSGRELLERMRAQAEALGVEFLSGRATAAMDMGQCFGVAIGNDYTEGRALILCTGADRSGAIAGERELLGRGVSYCVTCDGMLYRGRRTAVLGFTRDAESEAQLLRDMGCSVELFTKKGSYAILGEERVEGLRFNGAVTPCEAVFILRPSSAADTLLSGLSVDGGHITVNRSMETSLRGVFAAGDCTGEPYQLAKAVGEGNVAALSACAYLEKQ